MTPISIPEGRRLDPVLVQVLARVDAAARSQDTPYLLSGAMAREILLVHVHGLPPGRVTRDVDFGILVKDWDAFTTFKQTLIQGGDFVPDPAIQHRIYATPERFGLRMPVDLVPFGPIELPEGVIRWPPDRAIVMDVRGFHVGLAQVQEVEIHPGMVIPIPKPEAMLLMKALAWKDRGAATRGRDAIDLVEILERSEDLVGLDALYEDHLAIVEHHGGDLRLAAAEVMGTWAGACSWSALTQEVAGILRRGLASNLTIQVLAGGGGMGGAEKYASVESLVQAFLRGLEEPSGSLPG